jgi:hypothetical protein
VLDPQHTYQLIFCMVGQSTRNNFTP